MKLSLYGALLSAVLMLYGCNSSDSSEQADAQAPIKPWQSWAESLSTREYNVTQGSVYMVDNAACDKLISVFGTCFGNNPAAPYLIPQLPVGETYVDPYYAYDFDATGPDGDRTNMFFRLGENDALVTIVNLPPKAAYMGYQTYLFSRDVSYYAALTSDPKTTPDPYRAEIFGSLGNDINNVVVQNGANIAWSGNAVVYITTPNQALADVLVADAASAGLQSQVIFTEPVGDITILGEDSNADEFITLIRYALPEDDTAADRWKASRDDNILVYRVSKNNLQFSPFATPEYTQKMTVDESEYNASLVELTTLLATHLQTSTGLPVVSKEMYTSELDMSTGELAGLVGQECIAKGTKCLGDNQDTDAYRFGYIGLLERDHSAIVTGVNHTLNDAATYVSLAVYNMAGFHGVASISQTNVGVTGYDKGYLTGSAEAVLRAYGLYESASQKLKEQLPILYASVVSRDCEASLGDYCVDINMTEVPLRWPLAITQRAYVKPGSTSGASPNALLSPYVIKINK
ncbi:hypothetical protein [Sulfurimonas sp. HSL3-7]|uniref:hypothetical protein n=1 Tax=Sulfonitrofixus jiaomeiensis TaxID=3131938 RepID=UPI0031F73AE5